MIDVWRSGAVRSMTAYVSSLERATDLFARAEAMPVRRFFGDAQRAQRGAVIHQAGQALEDAFDAAQHVQDLDAVRFQLGAKGALVDAKLARGSLRDVPSYVAFRDSVQAEVERVLDTSDVVAGLGPAATVGQRAALLATVRTAANGDDRAAARLVQALVSASTTDSAIRTGAPTAWGAHEAVARALVERLAASADDDTILRQVRAAAAGWSDDVFASASDHVSTSAEDARVLLRAVRAELGALRSAEPAVDQLRASTIELIEQNERRLATNVGEGSGRGYLDHPDYADLGRIQANLRLLRSLDAVEHEVVAEPARHASEPLGSTAEVLSW